MNLYLDIETIGTVDARVIAEIAEDICAPGNITKPESIAAWVAEKKPAAIAEAVQKTAFDGALGRVIVVGYAIDNEPAQSLFADSERDLLIAAAAIRVHQANVVGHNVTWDIRFLWQRFVVNAVRPPAWLSAAVKAKPWDIGDTMTLWDPNRERKASLDKLCRALSIPSSKGEIDGSKVWDAFKAGRIEEIANYCRADVDATRACYLRMTA